MGTAVSNLSSRISSLFKHTPPMRLMLVGLDAAGKTTILHKLNLADEIATELPTIGFSVETVKHENVAITSWDLGGRCVRWRHRLSQHYWGSGLTGIIFVVDSNDRDRIAEGDYTDEHAKSELHRLLVENELRDLPLLVFANKQDLPNAMSVEEVTQRLGLRELRHREWLIQGSSAPNDQESLLAGMNWLVKQHQKKGGAKGLNNWNTSTTTSSSTTTTPFASISSSSSPPPASTTTTAIPTSPSLTDASISIPSTTVNSSITDNINEPSVRISVSQRNDSIVVAPSQDAMGEVAPIDISSPTHTAISQTTIIQPHTYPETQQPTSPATPTTTKMVESIDAHNNPTHTAKMVALRMIEVC